MTTTELDERIDYLIKQGDLESMEEVGRLLEQESYENYLANGGEPLPPESTEEELVVIRKQLAELTPIVDPNYQPPPKRTYFGIGGYKERDRNIHTIGFKSYSTYLRSPLWAIIRKAVLERDGRICQVLGCVKPAVQVHHISYAKSALVGMAPSMLFSICRDCHNEIEHDSDGKKLPLTEAVAKTFRLVTGLEETHETLRKWYSQRRHDQIQMDTQAKICRVLKAVGQFARIQKFWREGS